MKRPEVSHLIIEKDHFLLAEGLKIMVQRLESDQPFKLEIKTRDDMGRVWRMQECFQADKSGEKRVFSTNIDLFERLKRDTDTAPYPPFFFKSDSDEIPFELILMTEEGIHEVKEVHMLFKRPNTKVESVNSVFVGRYFKTDHAKGALLVLGGSSGGLLWSEQIAAFISSLGYNTLALNYFDRQCNTLPDELVCIELESVRKAYDWLRQREGETKHIHLMGISKGSELALLFASDTEVALSSVVAFVPTSHVYEGISFGNHKNKSSWTLWGQELPFIPYPPDRPFTLTMKPEELREVHDLAYEKANSETRERARIKVENIDCPVLLISGTMDNTWNSKHMASSLLKKIKENNAKTLSEHINFDKMGHTFYLPNFPPIIDNVSVTVEDAATANRESWEKIENFLKSLYTEV
ncbi:MAG TPA: acyl-CoA thioester hydrolase/BAAT C-terminal domain-containing protein [Thermotogota bacterium]|nr:acyl-CoA thioester hydrolase/BAAT C-terminal domain-containing protein [Thermotogota bacterium]